MPNNPGRIDGDYSIGEPEKVTYVNPGNFGAVRSTKASRAKYYAAAAAAVVVLAALVYFR